MELVRLQQAFKAHILAQGDAIVPAIVDSGELSARDRLSIYVYGYKARLGEALGTDYKAIKGLLGDDEFERMASMYIDAWPSRHYSLRWFGQHLAEFLEDTLDESQGFLVELARLEWAFVMSFDAADHAVVSEAEVAAIPPGDWPGLRLSLSPSLNCGRYSWNVLELWKLGRDEGDTVEPIRLEAPASILIWRQALKTRYRSLQPAEAAGLLCVMQGGDFSDLCTELAGFHAEPEVALAAASLLKTWINEGLVSGLEY